MKTRFLKWENRVLVNAELNIMYQHAIKIPNIKDYQYTLDCSCKVIIWRLLLYQRSSLSDIISNMDNLNFISHSWYKDYLKL